MLCTHFSCTNILIVIVAERQTLLSSNADDPQDWGLKAEGWRLGAGAAAVQHVVLENFDLPNRFAFIYLLISALTESTGRLEGVLKPEYTVQ